MTQTAALQPISKGFSSIHPEKGKGEKLVVCREGEQPKDLGAILRAEQNYSYNLHFMLTGLASMEGVWRVEGVTDKGYILLFFEKNSRAFMELIFSLYAIYFDGGLDDTEIHLTLQHTSGRLRAELKKEIIAKERYSTEEEAEEFPIYLPCYASAEVSCLTSKGITEHLRELADSLNTYHLSKIKIVVDEKRVVASEVQALSLMDVPYNKNFVELFPPYMYNK